MLVLLQGTYFIKKSVVSSISCPRISDISWLVVFLDVFFMIWVHWLFQSQQIRVQSHVVASSFGISSGQSVH
jgi:hypothetical protein